MKYKGFEIQPSYYVGTNFRVLADGRCVDRKPTKQDVEYYEVFDPMENGRRFFAENDVQTCKDEIDRILGEMGMPDNTPESWAKLES